MFNFIQNNLDKIKLCLIFVATKSNKLWRQTKFYRLHVRRAAAN